MRQSSSQRQHQIINTLIVVTIIIFITVFAIVSNNQRRDNNNNIHEGGSGITAPGKNGTTTTTTTMIRGTLRPSSVAPSTAPSTDQQLMTIIIVSDGSGNNMTMVDNPPELLPQLESSEFHPTETKAPIVAPTSNEEAGEAMPPTFGMASRLVSYIHILLSFSKSVLRSIYFINCYYILLCILS
jgi:hypothetical protein